MYMPTHCLINLLPKTISTIITSVHVCVEHACAHYYSIMLSNYSTMHDLKCGSSHSLYSSKLLLSLGTSITQGCFCLLITVTIKKNKKKTGSVIKLERERETSYV